MMTEQYNLRDCEIILRAARACGDRTSALPKFDVIKERQQRRVKAAAKKIVERWENEGTPLVAFLRLRAVDEYDTSLQVIKRYDLTCRGYPKGKTPVKQQIPVNAIMFI